ncbi:MAG: hypothetical protein AAF668_09120 [Pseudomonadota bacterium]
MPTSSSATLPKASAQSDKFTFVSQWLLIIVIAFGAAYYLNLAVSTIDQPLLDRHDFRQTQTAISTYYLLKDGLTLDYQTPVMGYPWTIPFEAPVYQFSVAMVASLLSLELDAAGRLVSILYFIGFLCISTFLLHRLFPNTLATPLIFLGLMLLAPIYLFWSRAFLIETCAIFFGSVFLLGVELYSTRQRVLWFLIGLIGSALCVLVKATTWPAFVIVAGSIWLSKHGLQDLKLFDRHPNKQRLVDVAFKAVVFGLLIAIPLLVFALWTHHADALKAQSELGAGITSAALKSWNYGSLDQRLSERFLFDMLIGRAIPNAIGLVWILLLLPIIFRWANQTTKIASALGAMAYFAPILVFSNLHFVHDYYQTANSLFLIASIAILLGHFIGTNTYSTSTRLIALSVFGFIALSQYVHFSTRYFPIATADLHSDNVYRMAMAAKKKVRDDAAIVSFGRDYSSKVHYYSETKGIAFPKYTTLKTITSFINHPSDYLGSLKLGGIADCRVNGYRFRSVDAEKEVDRLIDMAVSGAVDGTRWDAAAFGDCILYTKPVGSI